MKVRGLAALSLALLLGGCVTGWEREAPAGVYPSGVLSGPPTYFVGFKLKF